MKSNVREYRFNYNLKVSRFSNYGEHKIISNLIYLKKRVFYIITYSIIINTYKHVVIFK